MAITEFTNALPLSLLNNSSWIYLALWVLSLILSLAFIFYFNRLVGFVLSKLLQIIFWKRSKLEISMESCRLSFLGGRFFAKNLVIITANETVSIQNLNFTWRYWILKRTRLLEYALESKTEGDSEAQDSLFGIMENTRLPARFTLLIEGLEIFMYNRNIAYENMMDFLKLEELKYSQDQKGKTKEASTSVNVPQRVHELGEQNIRRRTTPSDTSTSFSESDISKQEQKEKEKENAHSLNSCAEDSSVAPNTKPTSDSLLHFLLSFLPISVRIKKGVFVVGNNTTPSIIVASYTSADALVDINKSPCLLDLFRQVFKFRFERFTVSLKTNLTYDPDMLNPLFHHHAKNNDFTFKNKLSMTKLKDHKRYKAWFKFQKSVDIFVNKTARKLTRNRFGKDYLQQRESENYKNWRGLRRYVGDIIDDKADFRIDAVEEYAKYSLILDSESTKLIYYYDIPGLVPFDGSTNEYPAPEFGLDIELSMATIHYGPWADKQRIPLQSMLFPTLYRDSEPSGVPTPGTIRSYKGLDILVEVKDEVIFRIPTREPSKDIAILKNYQQQQQQKHNAHQSSHNGHRNNAKNLDLSEDQESQQAGVPSRSFGWLELKMEAGSNISSHTSYVATKESGWPNSLQVEFISPELRSSVNHDVFFTADSHIISSKVGFPLSWNERCNWEFKNVSKNAKIFFLREHTMLFSDIFTDFASGLPTPYELFRQFHYQFNWKFEGYKLYLNVNDSNIIDNPLDFDNNKYLSFQGDELQAEISIPFNGQFTKSNTISYKIQSTFFNLILDTPPWHTTNAFMQQTKLVGKSNLFTINGSYTYFTTVEMNTSDHIVIDMVGDYVTLRCYGFVVRYLLTIRENYFGDNVHFKTFEEYSQDQRKETDNFNELEYDDDVIDASGDTDSTKTAATDFSYWKIGRTENDIDVLFMFKVRHGLAVLPYNIYHSTSHIGLMFDSLDVDIRFTNYYMDFQSDVSPISGVLVKLLTWEMDDPQVRSQLANIIFDIPLYKEKYLKKRDMSIDGLSIHGHRMFGLPPVEPTYYCKWDIAAGEICIDSDGLFLDGLLGSFKKLKVGYMDLENELVVHIPTLYDVTYFSFQCPSAHIGLNCEVETNTKLTIDLSSITFTFNDLANDRYTSKVSLIIPSIVLQLQEVKMLKRILGYVQTSINFSNFCQKKNFLEHRRLQQQHIRTNDAPFHRCPFLLYPVERNHVYMDAMGCFITSLTLPDVAFPLSKRYSGLDDGLEENKGNLSTESALDFDEDSDTNYLSSLEGTSPSFDLTQFSSHTKPTTKYDTGEFCPDYDIDPAFEYDSFIVDIGDINAFLSPRSLFSIAKLLQSFQDPDLTSLMDSLHIDILNKLKNLLEAERSVKNIRFVSPEINLKVGDFDIRDPQEIFQASPKVPLLNLSIIEPSVAFSVKSTNTHKNEEMMTTSDYTGAIHVKDIRISSSNPSDFALAGSIDLENIEFWFTMITDAEIVCSHEIDGINISVSANQVEWLTNYLFDLYKIIEPSLLEFKKFVDSKDKKILELVYMVSMAGKEYHIDYDPAVLTKPAYVLRSCTDHTRFHDSWKLMTRIRHVLDYLPNLWHKTLYESMLNHRWKAPKTACQEVLALFSRWRAWEIGDIQTSYFFQEIFPQEDLKSHNDRKLLANFKVDIGNLNVHLLNNTLNEVDFIDIEGMVVALGMKDEENIDLNSLGKLGILETLQKLEVVFHAFSYNSKVSDIMLDLIPVIRKLSSSYQPLNSSKNLEVVSELELLSKDSLLPDTRNKLLNFISNIENFKQQLILPYSSVELRGSSITTATEIYRLSAVDIIPFTISVKAESGALDVWGETRIISNSIEDIQFLVGNYGSLDSGVRYGVVKIKKLSAFVTEQEVSLIKSMESIIEEDIPYFKDLFPQDAEVEKSISTKSKTEPTLGDDYKCIYKIFGDVHLDFQLNELLWSFDLLYPLNISGKVHSNRLLINLLEEAVFVESIVEKFHSNLSIERKNLIRFENSQIHTDIKFTDCRDLYLIVCSINVGFTKVMVPQIAQAVVLSLSNFRLLEAKVDTLKKILNIEATDKKAANHPTTQKSEKIRDSKDLAFKFNFGNDYIGVSSFLDSSKISFELEGLALGAYNVANTGKEDKSIEYSLVPTYGELAIPTARISVLDRNIPVGLSSILDVNFTLNVLNSIQGAQMLQSLQLESQYCRICASPQVLFKIVDLIDLIQRILSSVPFDFEAKKSTNSHSKFEETESPSMPFSMPFSSINILSYNFCVGWLFGDQSKNYPGIIIGAERFFAAVEDTVGKFTLMEAYLSVANGSRSSNYYSALSEKSNFNRAYLPTMQVTYLIERSELARNLTIHANGGELDVKFLSDSIVLIENAFKSSTKVQGFFNNRVGPPPLSNTGTRDPSPAREDIPNSENVLQAYFSSIECVYTFAGSNILLYRINDENSNSAPSLFLHSPAVKIATVYKHKKEIPPDSSEKKHTIKCEVLTSPFDNTLYSSCVPVILDIAQGVKRMIKNTNSDKLKKEPLPIQSGAASELIFADVLKQVDLHFGLRIEKQKLSLSCEPTAKVEAIVAIGGIHFQVNTLTNNKTSITGMLQIEGISSSLQHVYSREVSGSIEIKNVILVSKVDFGDVTKVQSAGSLSDVSSYINVKQFQDLNLFKDIWIPKELMEANESFNEDIFDTLYEKKEELLSIGPNEHVTSNKNLTTRFKEVSTTNAVPWDFTCMIINFSLQVDFGQSLGNFKLTSNKIWAISNKATNWAQDLKIGIDSISLVLRGRLGGEFEVKNIFLHGGINWNIDGEHILDVPLVMLTGDIESLQLKSSFDYHVFALANFKSYSIEIFNQKSESTSFSKDHLYISTSFDTAEIYITSFAASNVMDIYNAIFRMMQENKNSYRETLRDSNRGKSVIGSFHHQDSPHKTLLKVDTSASLSSVKTTNPGKKLVSKIEVNAGHFLVHVYPSSFDDSKVLVVKLDESKINFDESEFEDGIANDLRIQFNGLKVSLSKNSPLLEDFILTTTVDQFSEHAKHARGGTIFVFPSFKISMKTFQKYKSNLIEYFYQSSFGGTVGIRWNLGSINFIREMIAIHRKALSSRTSYKEKIKANEHSEGKVEKEKKETSIDKIVVNENYDETINATIDKVSGDSKYVYEALATPIIEAPQLKELGNATPPLEWFGLHREKFPNVTHQLGIVTLQNFIHEIESLYSKVLGKA